MNVHEENTCEPSGTSLLTRIGSENVDGLGRVTLSSKLEALDLENLNKEAI